MIRALVPFSIPSNLSAYNTKLFLGQYLHRLLDFTLSERDTAEKLGLAAFIGCVVLIAIVAVFFAWHFARMHRRCNEIAVNASLAQNSAILDACEGIKSLAKDISIKISNQVDTPVSYGFFHPVIIIPRDLHADEQEILRFILLHESMHIKYFHYVWKMVSVLVVCVHWFNPFMWLLYRYLDRDMEIFCDKKVLQVITDEKREMYAKSLINMAIWQKENSFLGNNFVKKSMLKERIVMIMTLKKTSRMMALTSVLIFASAATAFATTDVSVEAEDYGLEQIQVVGVSDESITLVVDEQVSLEISYEEAEPYIMQDSVARATKSIYLTDYQYKSKTPSPKTITVTLQKDGYTYTGTLTYQYGEKTAAGTYVGYYSGYMYR